MPGRNPWSADSCSRPGGAEEARLARGAMLPESPRPRWGRPVVRHFNHGLRSGLSALAPPVATVLGPFGAGRVSRSPFHVAEHQACGLTAAQPECWDETPISSPRARESAPAGGRARFTKAEDAGRDSCGWAYEKGFPRQDLIIALLVVSEMIATCRFLHRLVPPYSPLISIGPKWVAV